MAEGITRRMFGGLAAGGVASAPSLIDQAGRGLSGLVNVQSAAVAEPFVPFTQPEPYDESKWIKKELEEALQDKSRGYPRIDSPISGYIRADVKALRSVSDTVKDRIIVSRIDAAERKSWEQHINKRIDELRAKLGILGELI